MIVISLFRGPVSNIIQRILISLSILIIGNLTYIFLTRNIQHFKQNKFAYITLWLTIAFSLGVSSIHDETEYEKFSTKRDFVYFGILIAFLIYIPSFLWLKSVHNITTLEFIYFSSFGIIITAISSLFTYVISKKHNLYLN